MFGEDAGYVSKDKKTLSDAHNAMIDKKVQEILKESKERVTNLLHSKEIALRNVSANLYKYDYLDLEDIERSVKGKRLKKEKVRDMDLNDLDGYKVRF